MTKGYRQLQVVEKELSARREYLRTEGLANFVKPKDKTTSAFLRALQHNLAVEVKDKKYLALAEERRQIIESQHNQGRTELYEATMEAELATDYSRRFLG